MVTVDQFPPLTKMGSASGMATKDSMSPEEGPLAMSPKGQAAMSSKLETKQMGKKAGPWVDLFKGNRFVENGISVPSFEEDEWELEQDDMVDMKDAWGICLIGYVLGRFPGLKAIDEVRKSWNTKHKFFVHESGWMVFTFEKEEDRDGVLMQGPYETFGVPWLLKVMPNYFNFGEDCFTRIPTWVKLPSLPLECWSAKALGKICSRFGVPVATDQCTALRLKPTYARILVEVDVTKPLVREIMFKLPNGKLLHQKVEYENEPKLCQKCHFVGHLQENCKARKDKRRGRSRSRVGREKLVEKEKQTLLKMVEPVETNAGVSQPGLQKDVVGEHAINGIDMGDKSTKGKAVMEATVHEDLASTSENDREMFRNLVQPLDRDSNGDTLSLSSFCKGMASVKELQELASTSKKKKLNKKKKKKAKKGAAGAMAL